MPASISPVPVGARSRPEVHAATRVLAVGRRHEVRIVETRARPARW